MAKPSPSQRRWLERGIAQPGGKLPLFDGDGQQTEANGSQTALVIGTLLTNGEDGEEQVESLPDSSKTSGDYMLIPSAGHSQEHSQEHSQNTSLEIVVEDGEEERQGDVKTEHRAEQGEHVSSGGTFEDCREDGGHEDRQDDRKTSNDDGENGQESEHPPDRCWGEEGHLVVRESDDNAEHEERHMEKC